MKNVRTTILLVLFGVIALALSVAPILHLLPALSPDDKYADASVQDPQEIEPRFENLGPTGAAVMRISVCGPSSFARIQVSRTLLCRGLFSRRQIYRQWYLTDRY
jgi:hypothetical protein